MQSSRPDLNEVLSEGGRSVGRRREGWLSFGLVVFQFALTLVLLTGAGIFVRSLFAGLEVNQFIPSHQLWTARLELPDARYKDTDTRQRFYEQLLPRLRALPGVTNAAIASNAPGLGSWRHQIELEHQPIEHAAQRPWIALIAGSPGYLETIHLPLLRGRGFNDEDGAANHETAILTREAARQFWPGQDPIGKRFRVYDEKGKPGNWTTVVGVTADIVQEIDENDPKPLFFVPYRQEGWTNMALVVESAADPIPSVRAVVQELDQDLPLTDILPLRPGRRPSNMVPSLVWRDSSSVSRSSPC